MPKDSGRTGIAGNRTGMRPIHIRTSKPSLLNGGGDNLSPASVRSNVPSRKSGFRGAPRGRSSKGY